MLTNKYLKERIVSLICNHFFSYKMEDTTRLTNEQSIKLFIQRDYSEGTAVKFQERFPSELEGKVNNKFFFSLNLLLNLFRLIVGNFLIFYIILI
jgi:hypothetical protein